MNKAQSPQTAILTIASVLVGVSGVLLNCTSADIAPSDGVLGVLVLASIAMIPIGYLSAYKNWQGKRWATRLMHTAILAFVVYGLCVFGSTSS